MRRLAPALCSPALVLLLAAGPVAAQGTLKQLRDVGPRDKRINLVILAEGYTAAQEAVFDSDAAAMMAAILAEQPLADYTPYFNVFSIFVASAESGSDHPSTNTYKDTYFNSTFDSYGITRLITIPPNDIDPNYGNGMGKVMSLLATHVPEYDIVLLLVNDPQYGGSGGTVAISSLHQAAPEIVLHELGHSFGDLADEYEDITPGYSGYEAYNSTAETDRALIRWRDWILPSTPIPTPENSGYASVVGLFEGSTYEPTGWYRPKLNCKMRSLGVVFCEVCREQMVRAEYTLLAPIDTAFPAANPVDVDNTPVTFQVVPLDTVDRAWSVQWFLDGNLVADSNGFSFTGDAASFGFGTHTLRVEIQDTTHFVRTDPSQLLHDSYEWTVNAVSCCLGNSGNVDCDPSDVVNIADLTALIDHLFIGFTPVCCPEEANADGDPAGLVNIADLTALIDHLFITFTAPAACN